MNRLAIHSNLNKVRVSLQQVGIRITLVKILSYFRIIKSHHTVNAFSNFQPSLDETTDPWRFVTPLKPINVIVLRQVQDSYRGDLSIALIVPCKNEISNIEKFLQDLKSQLLQPSRIIFVDGFSTDGTYELLLDFSKSSNGIEVYQSTSPPGQARNEAFGAISGYFSSLDYLIYMDMGCQYSEEYISTLISALEKDQDCQVACCPYGFRGPSETLALFQQDFSKYTDDKWLDWLPSIRGFAIRVGRTPEFKWPLMPNWVDFAGDDTLYAIQVRNIVEKWIVVHLPTPLVTWFVPSELKFATKVIDRYWFGDGQTGARDNKIIYLSEPWLSAHNRGLATRPLIDAHKRMINEVYVVLSLTCLGDSGGAHRPAQIAQEITRTGKRVLFLNLTDTNENLNGEVWFPGDISLLTALHVNDVRWMDQLTEYARLGLRLNVIITAPHPRFLAAIEFISQIDEVDENLMYDVIDDFSNSGLKPEWYSNEVENRIIELAETIVCVTSFLANKIEKEFGCSVSLIGNAIPTDLAARISKQAKEMRYSQSAATCRFVYAGALWGFWFKWDILHSLVNVEKTEIKIFGERNQDKENEFKAPNVEFCGLIPQSDLAVEYLSADFLIIPFEDSEFSATISPLKLYEYLLCARPIIYSGRFIPPEMKFCDCLTKFDEFFQLVKDNGLLEVKEILTLRLQKCKLRRDSAHDYVVTWEQNTRKLMELIRPTETKIIESNR